MPLPVRYAAEVPEMTAIWEPRGYFQFQVAIWMAQCEARSELEGTPAREDLDRIRSAVQLSEADLEQLNQAQGHETNRLLRLVQSRLDSELGNHLHRGNTSSDVLDTSLALQMRASLELLRSDFTAVEEELTRLAHLHRGTLQVGRSHGQHALPQTFGRQLAGWLAEVRRCQERLVRARHVISVGKLAGEIGTHVFTSPELERAALARLGLWPDEAPTQVVSRDRHAEVVALLAVNAGTLGRIATSVSLLGMTEVGEVREPFDSATQQGSSAMPHKRNTELSERVRGLARRVQSAAAEEMASQALWLERDISHSSTERFALPDAFGALAYMARLTTRILSGLVVREDAMRKNLEATHGALYAAGLLNALLATGRISRTEAYDRVKALAQRALDEAIPLHDLARADPLVAGQLAPGAIEEAFDPLAYTCQVEEAYRRLGLQP